MEGGRELGGRGVEGEAEGWGETSVTYRKPSSVQAYSAVKCNVLQRTVVYCTVLYCTVVYYAVLYCTVMYCTAVYCSVRRAVLCGECAVCEAAMLGTGLVCTHSRSSSSSGAGRAGGAPGVWGVRHGGRP